MDLSISQMMQLQKELFEPHKDKWHPMEPEYGKDFILYMIEEVGECIAILKRAGYDGFLSIEYEGHGDRIEGIKTGFQNLTRYLAELG